MKEELIKLDPSLKNPVLESVTANEQTGEESTLYDIFGSVKHGGKVPPFRYLAYNDIKRRETALFLAKLLVPVQEQIGQRLIIKFNPDQVPTDGISTDNFTISSFGNRRVHIVLPDPSSRGGSFLAQCIERIEVEIDDKWKDLPPSEKLTIDLKPFAKEFDAEQDNKPPYMQGGGFGGGGGFF